MDEKNDETHNQIIKFGQDDTSTVKICDKNKDVVHLSDEEKRAVETEILREIKKNLEKVKELDEKWDKLRGAEKNGPPLNQDEKARIERYKNHRKRTECTYTFGGKHRTENGDRNDKLYLALAGLCEATGTSDLAFGQLLVGKTTSATCLDENKEDSDYLETRFNSVANVMNSLNPQDAIEGMLISRLVALHVQSIQYLGCAANNEQSAQSRDLSTNRSVKLSRLYNETLDALMRYRRKGEQKVIVQHVNVNDGGKAIVGCQMPTGGVG